MAEKRYYWLKLKDDFFKSIRIKKLRKIAGGDTYLIIYLKMQLVAMKNDGYLEWKGVEDSFVDELALELDEDAENVKVTLAYLISCGLVETSDNINFFVPYSVESVGSESSSAQRVREFRDRKRIAEGKKAGEKVLPCNIDVTQVKQKDVTCNTEKEIEKEIDIEKEITVPKGTVCRTKDVRLVINEWNKTDFKHIERISPDTKRGEMVRKRIVDYGVAKVVEAVQRANQSQFLKGFNSKGWTADFDWFIKPSNFQKVLEGNYDNRGVEDGQRSEDGRGKVRGYHGDAGKGTEDFDIHIDVGGDS